MGARRLPAVLLTAGLLAGCGGDGGPSREQFVSQADERCKRTLRETPSQDIGPNDSSEVIQQKYQQQVAFYQRLASDLQGLEPPGELKADFEDYEARTRQQAENRREIATAQRTNDLTRFRALRQDFTKMNEAKSELRRKIGFRAC